MIRRFAAILLSILIAFPISAAASPERDQVGTSVVGFSSVCIDGELIDGRIFGNYAASAVVCWATWSAESCAQLELLREVSAAHPEYGVMGLLHTDATSTPEAALAFVEEHGYEFPVFVCDEVWGDLVGESMYIPQCFIVDRYGLVVEVWQAAFTSADTLLERLAYWSGLADGDVDMNGVINSVDALMIMRHVMGLNTLSPEQIARGDVDGDGRLTGYDALMVIRQALSL